MEQQINQQINLQDVYTIGEVYNFKIIDIFPSNYCKLIDEHTGIDTYLRNISKLNLRRNQIIECRIIDFDSKRPHVAITDVKSYERITPKITEDIFLQLLSSKDYILNLKDFSRLLLSNVDEITFEYQCHKWIQQQISKKNDLSLIEKECAAILEYSKFLDLCNQQEREFYQDRMTHILELTDFYRIASIHINNDKSGNDKDGACMFINNLYKKLNTSGFVYQPRKNFNILNCIFILKPEIMNSRIRELLDIISSRESFTWHREAFNNSLFKVLELFVSFNEDKIDKIKENKILVDNMLFALHLQLYLISSNTSLLDIDVRIIQSRLCLLSTYKKNPFQRELINNAFFNLFNSNISKFVLLKDEYKLAPYKIGNLPYSDIDSKLTYINKNVRIDISKDGINLISDIYNKNLRPVFPKRLGLWKNLQVFWSQRDGSKLALSQEKNLKQYQDIWNEIEVEFLTLKQPTVPITSNNSKRYRIEESVLISFIRQDETDKNKFYCQIEQDLGGEGFIYVNDIVSYSVNANLRDFYANDGSRYVFKAIIKDIENEMYHFSMIEEIKKIVCEDFYNEDEEILCSIGNDPKDYKGVKSAVAVTVDGIGISLQIDNSFENVARFDKVFCKVKDEGIGTFNLKCEMTSFSNEPFDIRTAFRNLMEEMYEDKIPENIEDFKNDNDNDNKENAIPLEEKYLKEVILLIDRMAYIENDYIKSYNYLGFARILCLLLNWDSQAAYYRGQMDIISNLHYFGINSTIDESKIKQLAEVNAELLTNNSILKDRFLQLQIISYKGKPEYNSELYQAIQSNSSLKELASLVLAFNITQQNKLENASNDIYNKIIQLLNMKGFETGLKFYGEENDKIEFKTSIIYTAGQGITTPTLDLQIKEILKVINAFLNTNGGQLYIGVNNSGLGVGIEEDLKTEYFYGDKDKYIRSIQDAIATAWNNSVLTTYIDVYFDEDNKDKDIIIINVNPHDKGVPFEDVYWVKANSTKRHLTKIEYEKYKISKCKTNLTLSNQNHS